MSRLTALAPLLLVCGCYSSEAVIGLTGTPDGHAVPDAIRDDGTTPDGRPDPEADLVPDLPVDIEGDRRDTAPDPSTDAGTGVLVPEGPEEVFETESGRDAEVHSGWLIPAAYSGLVYELIMDEDSPWDGDTEIVAVYRLLPGGTHLGSSWIDTVPYGAEWGTICWSGEVFIAILPTSGTGIRLLSIREDGTLSRPVEVLEVSSTYDPAPFGDAAVVLCPSTGPFVIDRVFHPGGRIYQLRRNGSPTGTRIDADIPTFGHNVWGVPCTEAGDVAVCATMSGITFIERDGAVMTSESISGVCSDGNGCDVAYTGEGVALVWSGYSDGKNYLKYARFDMDGRIVAPQRSANPIGFGPMGIHAASSGSTVLVAAEGVVGAPATPDLHLLDLSGAPLGPPLPITERGTFWHWRGMAVFWEGDAYSAIWNAEAGSYVAYRRYLVVD